jgi:hypothetical protein
MQLATPPSLALAVHENLLVLEQIASFAAGIHEVGELEQLPQADHVSADLNLALLHAG